MEGRQDVLSVADGRHSGGWAELKPGGADVSVMKADGKDQSPQVLTIAWSTQIFAGRPEPLASPKPFKVFGVLDWGQVGVQHRATFDWGRGGALTITATAFHLQARNLAADGPTITVRATASYAPRPGHEANRVTLTDRFEALAPGAPFVTPVPPFARMATALLEDWSVLDRGEVTVQFLGLDNVTLYEYTPKNCRIADSVEIPNDVVFVQVTKTAPGPVNGALCFHLSL
ncbi:hypothetical protein [Polyangium sp. 15x6]|uniref:hypothetical protein n=1 Tax=Polyangium sp. 15x6 TaxID=3042687 RepID=UPI00249B6D19|nr:hypothetical protein [Polyangium sp. 15x6]MDI3285166.1 hypothetical protein [Polyangium sp. 15x6]